MRDVASHRLKRSLRGALTATAVIAVVGMSSGPALADPPLPDNASDAAKQVRELQNQAVQITEDMKKAEDDHAAKQAELQRANDEAGQAEQVANQARADEERFRGQVDQLTHASYQGARLNKLSALLVSETPEDFLNRASALDALAKDNNDAVQALASARRQAETAERAAQDARNRAQQAEADAGRIYEDVKNKSKEMQDQIKKVQERYNELSGADQDSLITDGDTNTSPIAGAGAAIKAVNAALSKQGSPYVWGAKGPSQFDCSGLTYWAYKQAGVTLGGSTKTQVNQGQSVSAANLKPGDLIFYYSPVSHVSIYIGNGKAVHAPTTGDVVKVADYKKIGPVTSIRRVAG
ncbi:Cell wall-associated hydrolase, NlpC family [Saccharopolyspora antimicrobica]|uniref:Cell wall-associated NlpC family hydrolase n=2 Tax=Saccharopolyspora antimicrobica TaxID=455193 RepID=A0A1I5JD30_9PSEU|nr:cell wall-associated NlpC family hydrolase [Saccharopolyspora antimicrobica]SFO70540.1 Cell wall-associated hydrolase, NlpC family [Saccharopolyspora antimicrobica]